MREIEDQGYPGGISQLRCYLAPFKRQPEEPLIRFETPPGKQLQVDFTTIRRGCTPLKAFVAMLGYSRATFVRFSEREDSDAWLTGLREAFIYFGCVAEEALFDNAGTIITERDAYGEGRHRWHPALAALAQEYGFRPPWSAALAGPDQGQGRALQRLSQGQFRHPALSYPEECWFDAGCTDGQRPYWPLARRGGTPAGSWHYRCVTGGAVE